MSVTIQRDVSLQPYNSMAVPAKTSFLLKATSTADLRDGLAWASQQQVPWMVLGEGSNTLFVGDYPGLIILLRLSGIEVLSDDGETVHLKIAAGENWHELVAHTITQGWYGLENLALIPGLVGAAPIQNIGAYGVELKDALVAVEYLDSNSGDCHELDKVACQFGYRDSIFKHTLAARVIITSISLRLQRHAPPRLDYPALLDWFDGQASPSPQAVFEAVCAIRMAKLPLPDEIPNTGSFFKNPVVDEATYQRLQHAHPGLVAYPGNTGVKLAAGWLIEEAGWKDREHHGVRVHQQQALVIINPQQQSGERVLEFARLIQTDIRKVFSVELEIEPRIVV